MAVKAKAASSKGINKRPKSSSQSGVSSTRRKKHAIKTTPTQHKPKPSIAGDKKKKPPHLRYSEKELKVPQLNGIRPAGIQRRPNVKKGKTFVDDKESMNTIMAMVMAEKEGNIESKMMRARQMEEVREARRLEADKRAQSKKQGLEERKDEIRQSKKRRQTDGGSTTHEDPSETGHAKKGSRKRVSFG